MTTRLNGQGKPDIYSKLIGEMPQDELKLNLAGIPLSIYYFNDFFGVINQKTNMATTTGHSLTLGTMGGSCHKLGVIVAYFLNRHFHGSIITEFHYAIF